MAAGAEAGIFRSKGEAGCRPEPVPRYDLLNPSAYAEMAVQ